MKLITVAFVLKTTATLLIFAALAYRVDLDGLASTIRSVPAAPLFLGVLFGLLVMVASGLRWRLISGHLRVPLPARFAVCGYMESICFNLILPGAMAGDVLRVAKVTKARGHLRRNLAAVLFDRAANLIILLILCIPASVFLWGRPESRNLLMVLGFLGALSLVALCILIFSSRLRRFRRHRFIRELVYLSMMTSRLFSQSSVVCKVGLLSLCVQGLAIAMLTCAAVSVGINELSILELAIVTFLALLAAALPFTIAGFGLREGALIWTLEVYGIDPTRASAAAVIFAAILLLQAVPGFMIWVLGAAKIPQTYANNRLPESKVVTSRTKTSQY